MKARVILICIAAFLSGLPVSAREPSLTSFVPADAIVYIATPDLAQFDSQWSMTGFASLWQSEEFTDFRKAFHVATRLDSENDLSLFGINWQQLLSVSSGEACLALAPLGNEVGFLLLVDVSQHADECAKLVADLRASAPSRIYFLENGMLRITNRQELAKKPPKTLTSSKPFAAIEQHTHSTAAMLTWYIEPWAFQSRAMRVGSEETGANWQLLADNGFKVVQAMGGTITFDTKEHDAEILSFISTPGEREKAARMLDFSPLEEKALPDWIPANIDSVAHIQWNLADALAGYGSYFDAAYAEGIDGTFDAVLDDILQEPTGPQVDIMALMGLQDSPLLRISKTLDDGFTATVYAVKVTDEEQMVDALHRMFDPDKGVEKKTAGPFEMWVFKDTKIDPDAGELMGPDLANYALAAARGYFLVATSEAVLNAILEDNLSPKFTLDEGLENQLKDYRADNTIRAQISPSAAGLHPAYEDLRTRGAADLGLLLGDPENAQHLLDFSLLPVGSVLPKFIASGFGLVNQTEDGWLLQDFVQKKVK